MQRSLAENQEGVAPIHPISMNGLNKHLKLLLEEREDLDSLVYRLSLSWYFAGVNSKYLSLKSGDQLSVISNDDLLGQIVEYYEKDLAWITEWSKYHASIVLKPYSLEEQDHG